MKFLIWNGYGTLLHSASFKSCKINIKFNFSGLLANVSNKIPVDHRKGRTNFNQAEQ